MFILIENHIISINEIRNIELCEIGYGKANICVHFRNTEDTVVFSHRSKTDADEIFKNLAEACANY